MDAHVSYFCMLGQLDTVTCKFLVYELKDSDEVFCSLRVLILADLFHRLPISLKFNGPVLPAASVLAETYLQT